MIHSKKTFPLEICLSFPSKYLSSLYSDMSFTRHPNYFSENHIFSMVLSHILKIFPDSYNSRLKSNLNFYPHHWPLLHVFHYFITKNYLLFFRYSFYPASLLLYNLFSTRSDPLLWSIWYPVCTMCQRVKGTSFGL